MKLVRYAGLGLTCLITIFSITAECRGEGKWTTYKGAWFEIKYPGNFKVRPAQKSATSTVGHDSVFFASPDNTVIFYIFSPQWQGNLRESDIAIDPDREELIQENSLQERDRMGNFKTIRTFTVKARDASYLRAVKDEITSTNRLIFGIKYKNKEFYNKYYHDYLFFKKSLRQFAD